MRMTDPKAPDEVIPATFDFSELVTEINSVSVEVSIKSGSDSNPAALLYSSAQIKGAEVSQLIQGGIDGVIYLIKMHITSGDTQYTEGVYLPIREIS